MSDLQFQQFGKLAVVCPLKKLDKWRNKTWLCRCDCGRLTIVIGQNLVNGNTKSCGCLRREKVEVGLNFKHGDAHSRGRGGRARLHNIWVGMKQRCSCSNNPAYKNYGGRGIFICEEWKNNYASFKKWALEKGYANNLTIDRINNNDGYAPDNCQWITKSENSIKSNEERGKNMMGASVGRQGDSSS